MTNKRLLYLTLILTTLTIGVVIGTIVSGGVKAGEQKAQTIVIPDPVSLSNAFSQIAATLAPAVVNISTEATPEAPARNRNDRQQPRDPRQFDPFDFFDFFGDNPNAPDRNDRVRGLGSGFVVDKAGYILTNHHVIEKATKITVRLEDKSEYQAKLIGSDEETDLAVVKIDAGRELTVAKLGNSDAVKVGDWVLAVGSPFTLDHTVTHGIISAKGRDTLPGGATRAFQSFLQTDAAINPGNSGGPLVNMLGEVIGINTAIISETRQSAGLGFALPSNTATKVYNQLVSSGKVTRGGIGIGLPGGRNADLCQAAGLKSDCGVVVDSVTPGLPAAKAGIREFDVITEIDGTKITNQNSLLDVIASAAVGSTVRVKILRDGRESTIPVTIADRTAVLEASNTGRPNEAERNDPSETVPARLGIRIQDITADMARQLRLPSPDGVYVSSVDAGSAADDAGITRGTIITRIIAGGNERHDIRNVEDFRRIERSLKPGQKIAFQVLQQDRGQYRSTFVPLTIP